MKIFFSFYFRPPLLQFRVLLLKVLAADYFVSLALDRLCLLLFGEGRLRSS